MHTAHMRLSASEREQSRAEPSRAEVEVFRAETFDHGVRRASFSLASFSWSDHPICSDGTPQSDTFHMRVKEDTSLLSLAANLASCAAFRSLILFFCCFVFSCSFIHLFIYFFTFSTNSSARRQQVVIVANHPQPHCVFSFSQWRKQDKFNYSFEFIELYEYNPWSE